MMIPRLVLSLSYLGLCLAQNLPAHDSPGGDGQTILRVANGSYGPHVEEVHYYYVSHSEHLSVTGFLGGGR